MEVDNVPYIFGSFSRRRTSEEVKEVKNKRLSLSHFISPSASPSRKGSTDSSIQRARSFSRPFLEFFHGKRDETIFEEFMTPRKSAVRLALEDESPIFEKIATFPRVTRKRRSSLKATFKEIYEAANPRDEVPEEFLCIWCKKIYSEPRVLNCLHSFCTKCLFEIEKQNLYYSDPRASVCSEQYFDRRGSIACKRVTCPKCSVITYLSREGVRGLPPNYVLQHRLILACVNSEGTKLLCDLCSVENHATHRCVECLMNLCMMCIELHANSPLTDKHELLALKDKAITQIKRQIMCPKHKDKELSLYCAVCNEITCADCSATIHAYHSSEDAKKAFASRKVGLKDALERTKIYTARAEKVSSKIKANKDIWSNKCSKVQDQIDTFFEDYKKNLELHKNNLLEKVREIKDEQTDILKTHETQLESKIDESRHVIKFTDNLLKEGTETEILTFLDNVLKKLQGLTASDDDLIEPKITENVQFLENEIKENAVETFSLHGVLSTQKVFLDNCIVRKEGASLDNLRVHKQIEVILETRDSSENPLNHGGLDVSAELWYRDPAITCRALEVFVHDKKDGTYSIVFIPDTPGRLCLAVMIDGNHIKDSPFPIRVRPIRPHSGVYHCCSFCSGSAGGCGCGGRMPGSSGGCGHGHSGHPGRRHWSCCGNVLNNSECRRQSIVLEGFK